MSCIDNSNVVKHKHKWAPQWKNSVCMHERGC